jgi:hypothetical protein
LKVDVETYLSSSLVHLLFVFSFTVIPTRKLESGNGWIEYVVAVITAAKHLAAVISSAAFKSL